MAPIAPLQLAAERESFSARGEPARARKFGGGSRRGGAPVGDQIGNREVGFMTDAGDHRQRAGGNGARQVLVVERPQIFDAATAAGDDQHLAFVAQCGSAQRIGDRRRRALALHRYRMDEHRNMRRTAHQRGQQVAQCRRLQGRDDADAARIARRRALAGIVEQPFGQQFFLEPGEGLEQCAQTGAPHALDIELKIAARFVQCDQGTNLDLLAVGDGERHELRAVAEHHAAHLRRGILE